jgi:hypothetical protein
LTASGSLETTNLYVSLTGLPMGTLSLLSVNDGVATGGSLAAFRLQDGERASALTARAVHATTDTRFRMNLASTNGAVLAARYTARMLTQLFELLQYASVHAFTPKTKAERIRCSKLWGWWRPKA